MSNQERRAIASLVSTILISVLLFVYVTQRYPSGSAYSLDVFRFWGSTILIVLPVSIAVEIAIRIQFNILNTIATKETEPSIVDERDRLIGLRASRLSSYTFLSGFYLAMGSLVIDMPPSVMFVILIGSGVAAKLVGDVTQLYFYRK